MGVIFLNVFLGVFLGGFGFSLIFECFLVFYGLKPHYFILHVSFKTLNYYFHSTVNLYHLKAQVRGVLGQFLNILGVFWAENSFSAY